MSEEEQILALEQFIYKNEQLKELENSVGLFNIFDVLRIANREIRHSNFLYWLLSPSASHGLGHVFISEFIQEINYIAKPLELNNLTIFEADSYDYSNVEVRREWRGIDILILDHSESKLKYWLIENKIYSGEHSNQLERYLATVKGEFQAYEGSFFYLTIDGDDPSHDSYTPISYNLISDILDEILSSNSLVNDEVSTFIDHYNSMLKTQIMEESKIQEICRDIYKKHKTALDLIFQYKPDELLTIKEILEEIIKLDPRFILEDSNKAYIRFIPGALDFFPRKGEAWVSSNRILLFEFRNYQKGLKLNLVIGPGDHELRQRIYQQVTAEKKLFNRGNKALTSKWFSPYSQDILKEKQREDLEYEELKSKLEKEFTKAVESKILPIIECLSQLESEFTP